MLAFVVAHMLFLDRLIAPLFSWMPATLFQFSTVETGGDPLLGGALTVMIAAAFVSPGCRGRRSIAVSLVAHVTVNVVFTLLIIAAYLEAAA